LLSATIPLFADEDRIRQDIDEVGSTNTDISDKIRRANEDASSEMEALFLNNVDTSVAAAALPGWFVSIVTEYATSLFWVKSTGTAQAVDQKEAVYAKAENILIQRFQPVRSRVT
jgi:uncharacterized membrane protein